MPKAELPSVHARFPEQQVLLDEPVADLLDLRAGDVGGERLHRSGLEPVADDRAERERGTLDRAEPIEPRGEQGMECGRQGVRRAPLADVGHELFEEEGIAAGCVGDPSFLVGVEAAARDRRQQRSAGRGRERPEPQEGRLPDAARPAGPVVERVGARHKDEEHGHLPEPGGDVEQELHEPGLGPVDVLNDDDEWPDACQGGDQPRERPAHVLAGLAFLEPH